jgi:hypothetical protein
MLDYSTVKFGRQPPEHDPRIVSLASALAQQDLPVPPNEVDWSTKMPEAQLGSMLNLQLGCCAVSGAGHLIQITTSQTRDAPAVITDTNVRDMYSGAGGYLPGHPETDRGLVLSRFLDYWRQHGFAGHTIDAFARVQRGSAQDVIDAIWLCGGCYLGLALPKATDLRASTWDVGFWGTLGDGAPGSLAGHCVYACGYTPAARLIKFITWGHYKWMTLEWLRAYVEEGYALIVPDWIESNHLAPSGFSSDKLITYANSLR